jgi:magnesium chelatase subunit D
MGTYSFPFVSVIGQEKVKKALILNIINPKIGGVILAGEKGTGKSTLVRGLEKISDGMQVIDLPLNATEDRVIGSIDIEKTISDGQRHFEPGLLKKAHNNILYIDEVNLLSEHIVNSILEVASQGVNRVEREGVSHTHLSEFVLIGTMNEEEGHLRSQFLDRFGLYVQVEGSSYVIERKEIIKRRLEYEKSPVDFHKKHQNESEVLRIEIQEAKKKLKSVQISESNLKIVAQIVNDANCAGHRAELVIIETARALAAYDGRININIQDITEAAEYALPHRKREQPPQQEPEEPEEMENEMEEEQDEPEQNQTEEEDPTENQEEEELPPPPPQSEEEQENKEEEETPEDSPDTLPEQQQMDDAEIPETIDEIGRVFTIKNLSIRANDRIKRRGEGKRVKTKTDTKKGQYIKSSIPKQKVNDLAFDATLRAAAPFQKTREKQDTALTIYSEDIREKLREKRTGSTIIFSVDSSGSMGAKKRMSTVKGAVVSLLTDAYQKRDKVGLVSFRKNSADALLNITRSVDMAEKCLKDLPTGGKTPLSAGLLKSYEMIKNAKRKQEDILPILVVVSDGRTNVSVDPTKDPCEEAMGIARKIKEANIQTIVVDTEVDFIKLGLAKDLSYALGAKYFRLEELESEVLANAVRDLSNESMY